MLEQLARNWWAFLLRGIFAILFGMVVLLWPALTLTFLLILFGAYALVNGILLLIKAIGNWSARDDRWLLLLEGLLGIGVGIITFAAPRITALALLFYIAAWSLATGVMQIATAIRIRKEIKGEVWLILAGIASVLFAVLLMLFPGAGALGVIWMISTYAVVFGVLLVIFAIRLAGIQSRRA